MLSTYFLVSHGSRDPRSQLELQTLAELLSRQISFTKNYTSNGILSHPVIATGVLELGPKSLHAQIEDFWEYTRSLHMTQIKIIPLFLLPGVHVTEDLPAQIDIFLRNTQAIVYPDLVGQEEKSLLKAKTNLATDDLIKVTLCPYIGSHPEITSLLEAKITGVTADAWILISHGSRRPGSNEVVEKIAQSLQSICHVLVCTAYLSVDPDIKYLVQALVRKGYQEIGILPYFLFSGGITDAIAAPVNQLTQLYPSIKFHLTKPLGATEKLVKLVVDLIEQLDSQR